MTYEAALAKLYDALPAFHRVGAAALKPGLGNTLTLLERLGNPHCTFKSVHIAGTNGKGSTSHCIASILQESGFRTGLFTSPHLKEYRERIRINGVKIPADRVAHFVDNELTKLSEGINPSFFEVTVALCFQYFAEQDLDIAIIETGLGGRLDSTNVINPLLSVITNIGFDHQDLLGNTLPLIAAEKAGIIKHNTPVVISQSQRDTELVFRAKARHEHAPIYFASDNWKIEAWSDEKAIICHQRSRELYSFIPALKGNYQQHNAVGVLETIHQLRALGFNIEKDAIIKGLEKVTINTGLEGRWQILQEKPMVVADTAHNALGLSHVFAQAETKANGGRLFILFGVVGDKDLQKVYELLPKHAAYTFCEPSTFRKMPADQLSREIWEATGIAGVVTQDVNRALADTLSRSAPQDVILITGSTFLVADLEKNITN